MLTDSDHERQPPLITHPLTDSPPHERITSMFSPRLASLLTLALLAHPGVRAADVDTYLPADTESYLSINIRQILDSPLVKKAALGQLREALKSEDQVNDVLKDLGFDPFKDL